MALDDTHLCWSQHDAAARSIPVGRGNGGPAAAAVAAVRHAALGRASSMVDLAWPIRPQSLHTRSDSLSASAAATRWVNLDSFK